MTRHQTNDRHDPRGSDSEITSLRATPAIAVAGTDDPEGERDWGRVWETDHLLDLADSYARAHQTQRLSEAFARKLPC